MRLSAQKSKKNSQIKFDRSHCQSDCHGSRGGGRSEITPADVGDGVPGVWVLLTEGLWDAICRVARATSAAWLVLVAVVHVRVQPVHVHSNVVPHADDQNHAAIQSLSHGLHASLLCERVAVAERSLLSGAEGIGFHVVVAACRVVGVEDLLAILDVELLDGGQLTSWRVEPGHDLEWALGVDLELRSLAVEILITHAECVDVAAVTVSGGNEAIAILRAALLISHAHVKSFDGGRVGCECGGNLVCLPQIHLCAACAHVSLTAVVVRVGLVWDPSLTVGLAVHPLQVTGALSITVASSVWGTSRVGWAHVASLLHLREVV